MILNTAPQNEAIVSNVGEIGEFRIRNSAKAFNILSSGLYANKIRAIIRELSCNAVDSHVAANCSNTPFDVHLPNQLEPWFAIRDYGVGLDHEQVVNIYTTYFESTKTSSNEFIGALGLGSKSPFSYTDNFTVTATKNGRRGIYTAFINEQGIPSIALMTHEDTDEPNGVEVKFAVTNQYDFEKFRQEARYVYRYFEQLPVIKGCSNFAFDQREYESKDIIPGVHQYKNLNGSVAIMGNIAYGIAVPESEKSFGELRKLLTCGLEICFNIGELDFQASREGLSYIPQTVDAIKTKLETLNKALTNKLAQEANAIPNLWNRAIFLLSRKSNNLWSAAVSEYLSQNPIPTLVNHNGWLRPTKFQLKVEDLAKNFNIQIKGLNVTKGTKTISGIKLETAQGNKRPDGVYETWLEQHILVDGDDHFVINDIKRGALERSKTFYKGSSLTVQKRNIWIINPADKDKEMKLKEFFDAIQNPPETQKFLASGLPAKEKINNGSKKAQILRLEERGRGRRNSTYAWASHDSLENMDDSKTYYYVELDHWNVLGLPCADIKDYYLTLSRSGLFSDYIYGVRKGDIDAVKDKTNWIPLFDHVVSILSSMSQDNVMSLVKEAIDYSAIFKYNSSKLNKNSPYAVLMNEFKDVQSTSRWNRSFIEVLLRQHKIENTVNPKPIIDSYKERASSVQQRYPLLRYLSYNAPADCVIEYINMIDEKKGIENESI